MSPKQTITDGKVAVPEAQTTDEEVIVPETPLTDGEVTVPETQTTDGEVAVPETDSHRWEGYLFQKQPATIKSKSLLCNKINRKLTDIAKVNQKLAEKK